MNIKRQIINVLAVVVIVAIGFTASRSYDNASFSLGNKTAANVQDRPALTAFEIVEVKADDTMAQIALLPKKGSTQEQAIADFMAIYHWGRAYFRPTKCGREYPAYLCKHGQVHINYLSTKEGARTSTGPAPNVLWLEVDFWLDQEIIDKDLFSPDAQPFTSMSDLFTWHQYIAKETEGTGGDVEIKDEMFTGLK